MANAPPGFHAPNPPADRRIVNGRRHRERSTGDPSRQATAERAEETDPGGRSSGSTGGTGLADRDGNNRKPPGREGGSTGGRRVLTNDDVQARVPRTDVPAQAPRNRTADADRTIRSAHQGSWSRSPQVGWRNRSRTRCETAARGRPFPEAAAAKAVRMTRAADFATCAAALRPTACAAVQSAAAAYSPPNRQPEHQSAPPAAAPSASAGASATAARGASVCATARRRRRYNASQLRRRSRMSKGSDDGGRGGRPK